MMAEMQRVGLLAGEGVLPTDLARRAVQRGIELHAIAVVPNVDPVIQQYAASFVFLPLTQLQRIVDHLLLHDISTIYVMGSVDKRALFAPTAMDERFVNLLQNTQDHRNHNLFVAFADDLAKQGIAVAEQTTLLPELVAQPGVLTRREPTAAEFHDIQFARTIASAVSGFDIGQTVVVKQKTVLAVEAIEGTNATLQRGAQLGNGDVVAVKLSPPGQDMRFDVPAIGTQTVKAMAEHGVRVLAFEASRTLLLQREEMETIANEASLTLLAMTSNNEEGSCS